MTYCVTLYYNKNNDMKIGGLKWDDENIEHISKHSITPSDIEDVCFGTHITYPARYKRYLVYGKTYHGKYIKVVLEHLYGTMFRPKTSYLMTESEKGKYKRKIQ